MREKIQIEEGKNVNIYSSQSNNIYEIQAAQLREKARNDPNHFYTYRHYIYFLCK